MRARKNQYFRERRRRLSETGVCTKCGKLSAPAGKRQCKPCINRNRTPNRVNAAKGQYKTLRDEVFAQYGGYVCACCAEDEPIVLTIDHIENNGREHRQQLENRRFSGEKFYRWLRRNDFPPGYQVLCWNCNMGKYRNGGVCPHNQHRRTAAKQSK